MGIGNRHIQRPLFFLLYVLFCRTYRTPIAFERRWTMNTIRSEVSAFARAAEYLLSDFIQPPLTTDEQALIDYYVAEVVRHFQSLHGVKINGV